MESTASTDERLNLLAQKLDLGFDRMNERLDEGFARMDAQLDRVDRDIREVRDQVFRLGGRAMAALVGVIVALIGVIGAIIATGV